MHPTKCSKWDPQINHSYRGYQICFLPLSISSLMFLHLINFYLNKVQRRKQAYKRVSWRPCFSLSVFPWVWKLNQFVLNSLTSIFSSLWVIHNASSLIYLVFGKICHFIYNSKNLRVPSEVPLVQDAYHLDSWQFF